MSKHEQFNRVYRTYVTHPRGFGAGVRDGLGSYAGIWRCRNIFAPTGRVYPSDGLARDWKAVGSDLQAAIRNKANERQ